MKRSTNRKKETMLGILSAILLLVSMAGPLAHAQAITGVVRDPSGALIPGVSVEASSPALIEKFRAATTNSQGEYKLVDLRPGTYTVTFRLAGFTSVKRGGIELSADFTATVDADLAVGSATQTVEIQAGAPLVDVQNVNAETNISEKILDNSPVSKNVLGFSALTVGAIIPQTAQDVGGSKGEISVRLAFHGGHQIEQKLLLDGMIYNTLLSVGNRTFFPNPASTEEFTITNGSAGSAEVLSAGAMINTVPRDGGNTFHGTFYTDLTGSPLQGTNVTSSLVARGLTVSNGINKIYDYQGSFGGPILHDRLWFFTAYRNWGDSERGASLQENADPNAWIYTPNGIPVIQYNSFRNANGRLTWQANAKNRFTFSMDSENDCLCNAVGGNLFSSNISEEADQGGLYLPDRIYQATWNSPITSRLLLEAGMTVFQINFKNFPQSNIATNGISVTDSGTGLTYRAPASLQQIGLDPQQNYRAAASYLIGSHSFKVGMLLLHGSLDENTTYNPSAVSYTFTNGTPTSVTEYAAPLHTHWVDSPTLGLYAQDQWTLKRLTLSYGVRFDHQGDYVPANSEPVGVFVPARTFGRTNCVPCWNDLNPRVGVSYNVFGNGKTAVKAGIGRYVLSQTTGLASTADPASTTVASTTRKWTDSNHDFTPDCDLTNPLANGECGADANQTFGTNVVTTTYDPKVLNGWWHRPYNWQLSAGIQHQIGSRIAVNAMFFRTWYGNFTATDNLDVTPSDYSPYCVPEPSNADLPGGGGDSICGFYDLNPNRVGQVNNYVTFASHYGKQTETYQGLDLTMEGRFGHAQIAGGINIGNSNGTTSSQSDCFVVDSPQQQYQCDQPFPYQTQLKFQGYYQFPLGLELSGDVQSLPGIPVTATWAAPNSLIAPSLGRNLSSGSTASIALIRPSSEFAERINQVDLRVTKTFHIFREMTAQALVDLANVFNGSAIEAENLTYGAKWLTPTQILDPRLVKFGARVQF
jgi:hypothetical protein